MKGRQGQPATVLAGLHACGWVPGARVTLRPSSTQSATRGSLPATTVVEFKFEEPAPQPGPHWRAREGRHRAFHADSQTGGDSLATLYGLGIRLVSPQHASSGAPPLLPLRSAAGDTSYRSRRTSLLRILTFGPSGLLPAFRYALLWQVVFRFFRV